MTREEMLKECVTPNEEVFDMCDAHYRQGRADGYSQAENDYHKQTEKDRKSSYDCGYQQGRADAINECIEMLNGIDKQVANLVKELFDLKEQNNDSSTVDM